MRRAEAIIGSEVMTRGADSRALVRDDLLAMLAGRVLPASFFALVTLVKLKSLSTSIAHAPRAENWLVTAGFYANCMHRVATVAFLGLVVLCFVTRMKPAKAARSAQQIAVALTGTFIMTLVAVVPQTPTPPLVTIMAALIMLTGSVLTASSLVSLGRSFSITPEARALVTSGLYSYVRHPMYLGEMVGSLGMVLQALSPFTMLVFLIFCLMQIRRMDYEEVVLQQVFPDYRTYRLRTARLIPKFY